MSVLDARGLAKNFGETRALRGIDLRVEPGEIFGLIGPDGAGKTTALRLLVGVLNADAGTANVAGFDVAREAESVREHVGYMPQQFALYGDLTVAENMRFFADMYFVPKREREERLARLYAFSRLEPFARRPAGKLSGGMQKKLALSCNMIHQPALLLLDEPTTGVDPVSRRELWEILYAFAAQGVAIVVSTPYMDEAERCHRVGLIHAGRLLVVDTPRAVIDGHAETIIERVGDENARARTILAKCAEFADVYPFGDALHIAARPGVDALGVIRETLAAAGIEPGDARRVRPTFEDVFMARIREAEHD
ncbi:MAG: ABC transporter ATP-binding protein [Deltaproteobacteria bacterium]|nr:ABC transporter ATP-binding protein [Deltaproteobacteria bacterium]